MLRVLLLTIVFAVLSRSPAAAQAGRSWVISPGWAFLRVNSDADGWGFGPSLAIRRDFHVSPEVPRRWGVELSASAPAFGNNAGGVATDLGATLTWAGDRREAGLAAGLTAFLVGDASEFVGGGVGGFVGGHATAWLGGNIGLFVEARGRLAAYGGPYLSGSAGAAIRL